MVGQRFLLFAIVGAIAVSPAVYFVIGNILTFELGLIPSVEIRTVSPIVLLGGCSIAALLNLWLLLTVYRRGMGINSWLLEVTQTRKSNLLVSGIGFFLLAFLVGYAIVENWVPH